MPSTTLKKTVKNETLRPYALSSENPWLKLLYRFDPAEPWQNALESTFIVLPSNREDVRFDVLHAFDIEVDLAAVRDDGFQPEDVELVVLTRDNFAKRIVQFYKAPLSTGATASFHIPRAELEATSLAARIDFHVMLVLRTELQLRDRRIRQGGRLSDWTVSVSAEKKGHAFNFSKTTKEEFEALDLPGSTTFHLQIPRVEDLVEPCDDVSSVLSVLVHEDAWSSLQEIRNGDRVGEALGTMFLCELICAVLGAVKEALADPDTRELDDASIAKRMLKWVSEGSGKSMEHIEGLLTKDDGLAQLQALVQARLRVTPALQRIELGQEDVE